MNIPADVFAQTGIDRLVTGVLVREPLMRCLIISVDGFSLIGYHVPDRAVKCRPPAIWNHYQGFLATTLASRNNLANAYQQAGRYAEAIPIHEATLKVRERVLGPEHPDTLASRNNLAAAYSDVGRTQDAEALLKKS